MIFSFEDGSFACLDRFCVCTFDEEMVRFGRNARGSFGSDGENSLYRVFSVSFNVFNALVVHFCSKKLFFYT